MIGNIVITANFAFPYNLQFTLLLVPSDVIKYEIRGQGM